MTINFHDSLWAVFFNKQNEKSDFFVLFYGQFNPIKDAREMERGTRS